MAGRKKNFPSFSEGLSLRVIGGNGSVEVPMHFPSFSEGLSLRDSRTPIEQPHYPISLPFRRDFH